MAKVFVGLSGGVDSAVSAYILKKKGYEVVGAFIKGWEPDFLSCTAVEDRLSAMRVAAHLAIPFIEYDLEQAYKREVVEYFISEYRVGKTPNPDVICNRTIKFGIFWERAKADGADFLATGHYATTKAFPTGFELQVSKDKEKDQTYFLWTLRQEDLSHSLFPVGEMTKSEVRVIAKEVGLPNALRKDSQGLCFLGHVNMMEFLKRYIKVEQGVVCDESGVEIGKHQGVQLYTLGQRHGFNIETGDPHYIVRKDLERNELIVSQQHLGIQNRKKFTLSGIHWVSGSTTETPLLARYRYRQELISASVSKDSITFGTPQLIASGQSVVFYNENGEKCLGGAFAA